METRIINIDGSDDVQIICRSCWKINTIWITGRYVAGKEYKLKCKCGEVSVIKFERRRNPRKKENVLGVVYSQGTEYLVDVIDLSINGCCFIYKDSRCKSKLGDKVTIRFKLPNYDSDFIECSAIVRNTSDRVGIEFINITERVKRSLGFHFLA